MFVHTIYLLSRKLGINWGKSNTYGSVTKQCYIAQPIHKCFNMALVYAQLLQVSPLYQ